MLFGQIANLFYLKPMCENFASVLANAFLPFERVILKGTPPRASLMMRMCGQACSYGVDCKV